MMAPSPGLRRIGWSTRVLYYPDSGRVRLSHADSLGVYTAIQGELKEGAEVLVARFHVHTPAGARVPSASRSLFARILGLVAAIWGALASIFARRPSRAAGGGTVSARRMHAVSLPR